MDVAIATISNNIDLVMDLTEETFNQVMHLMNKMTKYDEGDGNVSFSSRLSLLGSLAVEWSPSGAEKCLKFLHAAVWVNGKRERGGKEVIILLQVNQFHKMHVSLFD